MTQTKPRRNEVRMLSVILIALNHFTINQTNKPNRMETTLPQKPPMMVAYKSNQSNFPPVLLSCNSL